jgi:hypothetical protein
MIVRISGEGQFELPEEERDRLNDLDNQAVAAVEADDRAKFRELWEEMLGLASGGRRLDDDELVESDVILPPRDMTFEEAQAEFTGDGLIPDGG